MATKFSPKEGHFEKRSQSCPNSLVFHRKLSDAGKLLILALNGISSTAPRWVIIQSDLQGRMGWGKEKMQAAIRDCVQYGYLKVKQAKRQLNGDNWKKGQFSHNEFEFDLDGGYLTQTDLSSGASEPKTGFPSTAQPSTVYPPLTCSSELNVLKEQTNKEGEKPVVVCSSQEEEEKRKILAKYQVGENFIQSCLSLSIEHLSLSCLAFDQYAQNKKLDNPHGCLRQAIAGAWKPNFTKQDKVDLENQKKADLNEKIAQNRQIALNLQEKYRHLFSKGNSFDVSDNVAHLNYTSSGYPLNLGEDDCIAVLEYFIDKQLLKN